jgi:GT2 family glycosyltransferase
MKISTVIRTRDEENGLKYLLGNLAHQTIQPSELIVVDNYSSEKKLRNIRRSIHRVTEELFGNQVGLKLVALPDADFSHAYSTNLGVNAAENELVSVTNAHSIPISLRWSEEGVKHFRDSVVAGVSGFFVPRPDSSAVAKLDVAVYYASQKLVLRQDWCSTINCIIRKSLWKDYPFDENLPRLIPETRKFGLEDYDWSREMMSRGRKIVVVPAFSVFHSHGEGAVEMTRNVRGYFIYRRIQQKINMLSRPRKSFTRISEENASVPRVEILI